MGQIINIGDNTPGMTVNNVSEKTTEHILNLFSFSLYKVKFKDLSHTGKRAEVKQFAADFFEHCKSVVLNR